MRISDWSSDVCSSDLHREGSLAAAARLQQLAEPGDDAQRVERALAGVRRQRMAALPVLRRLHQGADDFAAAVVADLDQPRAFLAVVVGAPVEVMAGRSEEHTSELQSLMRISYAVFCLKKKNTYITPNTTNTTNK